MLIFIGYCLVTKRLKSMRFSKLVLIPLTIALVSGCVSENPSENSNPKKEKVLMFGPENISFNKSLPTISNAQKFILPIPAAVGEPLVYPAGATQENDAGEVVSIAGQPILDWEGNAIGEQGVVFFNAKDRSWQAVGNDGQGVIIMNQVTEDQSKRLIEKIRSHADSPMELILEQIKAVLRFAQEDLKITDMYNSGRDFIKQKMNPIESCDCGIEELGLHRRDDRDICQAILVEGKG